MVITLVFMSNHGLFQLIVHIILSFFILLYIIQVQPYFNENLNSQEICNEVFIVLSAYHFLIFTDFVPDNIVTATGLNFKE